MTSVRQVGQEIVEDADDLARRVTGRWGQLAAEEPWLEPVMELRQDNLPNMIRALGRAALVDPENEDYTHGLIREAREHGASRRREGHDDSVIPAEFVLLRRSLRHILIRERDVAPHLVLPTLARLELGMGTAETASLYGYHSDLAPDPEESDNRVLLEWSGLFHEIVDDSTP